MAVNRPSPRAKPEDKVCLRGHKSMATRAISDIYFTKSIERKSDWSYRGCLYSNTSITHHANLFQQSVGFIMEKI